MSEQTKKCQRCYRVQPVGNFKRSDRTADGYGSRCVTCIEKRRVYGDGTADDAYCQVCGVIVPPERARQIDRRSAILCKECDEKVHRWKHMTWMLCVRDPGYNGAFRGGHFQVREVREMLLDGGLDEGTEFEVYHNGQYVYRVRVLGPTLHWQVCIGVDDDTYRAKGDKHVLIGGAVAKKNGTQVWFQRGLERTKGHADFEWILDVARPAAEKRLGHAVTTIVVPPGEADKVPTSCGLAVIEDPVQLVGTFGLR